MPKMFGPGFALGGYTGDEARNQVAGVVHGQEFVMNAEATRRYRPVLESMNSGRSTRTVAQNVSMNVTVHNQSSAHIAVERISATDVRIIARNEAVRAVHGEAPSVVAAQIADPNSRVSRSIHQHTSAQRKR
jgi:hypothetical protein